MKDQGLRISTQFGTVIGIEKSHYHDVPVTMHVYPDGHEPEVVLVTMKIDNDVKGGFELPSQGGRLTESLTPASLRPKSTKRIEDYFHAEYVCYVTNPRGEIVTK